jgi:hypothetical protein
LGKKDLIKKIPFKKFSLKIPSQKKVAAADCFAAWDIAFYYIDYLILVSRWMFNLTCLRRLENQISVLKNKIPNNHFV